MSETTQAMPGTGAAAPPPAGPLPPPAGTIRPGQAEAPRASGPAAPRPAPSGPGFPGPAAFRASQAGPEDKLIGQVAFAMAAEAGTPPRDAEAIQVLRDQATAALSDFAFRYLHNRVEEIRKEAAAEATTSVARGPGFLRLVLANLVALGLGGAALYALVGDPHLLARLTGH